MTGAAEPRSLAAWADTTGSRYRTLFAAIDEGFCIVEILWDGEGRPADYRFLEVNPAFERHTGLRDAVGRTARQLVPDLDEEWFAIYGRVARTGQPVRFENDAVAMGRTFDVFAFPVGAPGVHQVAVLFTDISERRRRERHLAFLAGVGEATDRLSTVAEITRAAGARLGTFLGIARCDIAEIDEAADEVRVIPAWTADGVTPAPERVRLSDFVGDWLARAARSGQPVVVHDVRTDPRTHARADAFVAAGAVAWLAAPVVVDRASPELRVLVVNASEPRHWARDEVELVAEVAGRLVRRLERAQAQEAVRERDLRLRLALDASGAGTFVWFPQEDRAEPDERMRELLGLAPGAPATLRAALDALVHPDERGRTQAAVTRALDPSGDGRYVDEVHLLTPGGDERWLSVAGRVEFAGDPPRATKMFGMATDVTARRRAEEALRASAERQAFLVRLTDELRPRSRPSAIRQAAARVLRSHLGADRVVLVEDPSAAAGGIAALGAVGAMRRAGGPTAIDDVASSPLLSARERDLAATMGVAAVLAAPVGRADGPGGVLLVADAAPRRWRADEAELVQEVADRAWTAMERARAAAAVRESERRLGRALAIETVGVAFFRRDGTLTDANDAFLRASGYGREDVERGELTWESIAPEDQREAALAAMAELRRRGRTEPREREYLRRDGTRWPALAAATMLSRAEGVEFVVDLTDVRAAQEAARAERAVREQREREFVANAAHEMRTPLTAIIGAVQALQTGAADIPAERERFLAHLGREAARLSRLNESLLVLAQIDGTRVLERGPVDLPDLLAEVAADLDVAPGVGVRVEVADDLAATTHRGLLERVIANVAENAAKHTAEGRVVLSARREGGALVVEVRDTGSGVAGDADRAFDRFYRGGERSSDGFGLGLAIARQAAAALGGALTLAGAPGGGTVARLELPESGAA